MYQFQILHAWTGQKVFDDVKWRTLETEAEVDHLSGG